MAGMAIFGALREVATALPPYGFPTAVSFDVRWPSLTQYVGCVEGAMWAYTRAHHQGHGDIAVMLEKIRTDGRSFCTRRYGNGDQSIEAFLRDLRDLAFAFFELNERRDSATQHGALAYWLSGKMSFVIDNMQAVIDAEKAYTAAPQITQPLYNDREAQRTWARFKTVLHRTIYWQTQITRPHNHTGVLVDSFGEEGESWTKKIKFALKHPLRENDPRQWQGYKAGSTKCTIKLTGTISVDFDQEIINLLPNIVKADWIQESTSLRRFTRELAQQYIALRALLHTCEGPVSTTPGAQLPNTVQLDESHSNQRSIMVFKSAWLVLLMAEVLWKRLLRFEREGAMSDKEGEVSKFWLGYKKPEIRRRLEKMTRIATITQMDAAREALRYEQVPEGQDKYW